MTHFKHRSRQSGAALVTALIFLVVLTLLGITGAQNTVMEERMTGNYRDYQIAHEAAEAALQEGLKKVLVVVSLRGLQWDGSDGTYDISDPDTPSKDPFLTPVSSSKVVTLQDADGDAVTLHQDPNYYIERLDQMKVPGGSLGVGYETPEWVTLYRVTARGWGKSDTGDPQVILQTTAFAWE